MGKNTVGYFAVSPGREQSHLKEFVLRMFESGSAPEEALQALKSRFDMEDFARARKMVANLHPAAPKDSRGRRTKT